MQGSPSAVLTVVVLCCGQGMRLLLDVGVTSQITAPSVAATNTICNDGAVTVTTITFLQNMGNLPLLSVQSQLTSGIVTTAGSVDGSKENVVCNNRGLCDTSLGVCACFQFWGGSNGQLALGNLPDCGARKVPAVGPTTCPSTLALNAVILFPGIMPWMCGLPV